MLIQGTSVSVTYKRIEGIKKAYYNNENILKSFFNEATVLPVPDDAPDEIPRIMLKTLHEHAQLSITPVAATFEVSGYDEGFEKDWAKCAEYICSRMEKVFDFLNVLTQNSYDYIGVVTSMLYDEVPQNGTEKLASTLLNVKKIKDIYDINIKYTFVERDMYYVNILLQNARLFKAGIVLNESGALSINNQTADSIGAIIDINDRYSFNNCEGHTTRDSNLGELVHEMSNVINNKLHSLIEKGEY